MSVTLGLLLLLQLNPLGGSLLDPNPPLPTNPTRLASFSFERIPSFAYAGEPFNMVIQAKDELGANYSYTGLARVSTTLDSDFVYITPTQVSFIGGRCSTFVGISIADTVQIRCSDPGNLVTSTSPAIEVLPGMPYQFLSVLPGEALAPGSTTGRRSASGPDAHIAGDTFAFDVYVTDSCFNPIAFRQDSITLSSTDSFGQLPAGGRLSNGRGTFTASIRTAGNHGILVSAAASSAIRPDTSSVFTVLPGGYERLLLLFPGEQLLPGDTTAVITQTPGKTGTPATQYLRAPFSVRVLACDSCWNRAPGFGDSITLGSNSAVEFAPDAAVLNDSAAFTVQFNTSGSNQTLRVLSTSTGRTSYWNYIDIRARGARLLVDARDTVFAGETAYVDVTVLDANSSPIVATRCDFSVTAGHGDMLDAALLTDTLGKCRAGFLCTEAHFGEFDSILVSSGVADTTIGVYVDIPDSSVMKGKVVAFPNPFGNTPGNRTTTTLTYYLQYGVDVHLSIYDPFGNQVLSRSYTRNQPGARAGINQVYWDGRNAQGRTVASGIYAVQVTGQDHTGIPYRASTRVGVVW
jgi:hypothetical protein